MKITIEGDLGQIMDTLGLPPPKGPKGLKRAENEARAKVLADRRHVVRRAFDKIRYTKDDRVAVLLRGLTIVNGLTEAVLETARQVLAGDQ